MMHWIRGVGIALLAGAAGYAGAGLRGVSADSDTVTARAVVLVTDDGQTVGKWGVDKDKQPYLTMSGFNDREFSISLGGNGISLDLSHDGGRGFIFTVIDGVPTIHMDDGMKARLLGLDGQGKNLDETGASMARVMKTIHGGGTPKDAK